MRQILPGQKGDIKVEVRTDGYGGRKIRETVRIQTNDPDQPWIQVTVTGRVKKFVDIRPRRVRLVGPPGKPLAAEVEIIPGKDYPFTVKEVTAKNGKFINYELTRRCTEGNDKCVIRVENKRNEKGRYYDVLYVRTDSKHRPELSIHVVGMIR